MADFNEILAQLSKNGVGGSTSEGPTRAEASAAVQNVYQRLLGRSAVGTELNQAISQYMNTGVAGAVEDFVMSTNEFQAKSENKYLDAIYNELAQNARKAQA